MKNFFAPGIKYLANISANLKKGKLIDEVLNPLSNYHPTFALLRARLNDEMSQDQMLVHLKNNLHPSVDIDCYDLVVLYNFCQNSLMANALLGKKSRREFMYYSHEAGHIFYGHTRTTRTLTVYVLDEKHLDTIQNCVSDKLSKMRVRNKSPFPIPTINVMLLKDHPRPYRKFKADIFCNIPFIVNNTNLDPQVENV